MPRPATLVLIAILLGTHALPAADRALLSDNIAPGTSKPGFPEGTRVITTGMTHAFVTTGSHATDAEAAETGRGKLFDGNTGSDWRSRSYSSWGGGRWITLDLDLGQAYAVGAVDVWALHEATRDTAAIHLLSSEDGTRYVPYATAAMDPDIAPAKDRFARITLDLETPLLARYLQLRIERVASAKQQQVGEVAIWGHEPDPDATYLQAGTRPEIEAALRPIQAGVIAVDWSRSHASADGVTEWRVYRGEEPFTAIDQDGVSLVAKADGAARWTQVFPVEPGATVHLGVTAVYPEGEYPVTASRACVMPMPLQCDTFGDMVAINHFWGGGSHRQADQRDAAAYETVALDLLQEVGIRHVRWWKVDPAIYRKFYARGIGMYAYPYGDNLERGSRLGVWAYAGPGNEPDLRPAPAASYVAALAKVAAKRDAICPQAVICAPSSGLEDHSLAWLEAFYQAGGKEHFEILDLHTYCKIAGGHRQPEGYPAGAPEAMIDNMRKVRAILAAHGDTAKPIISTEFGYSEAPHNNPSGAITPERKAAYIARGLILHHALGFSRVFLYSFWDEGDDADFTEHTFGLIDYRLQKKPAYHAVRTLIDILGPCALVGPMAAVERPSFGYHYRHGDAGDHVYALWDGTGPREAQLETAADSVQLIDLEGATRTLVPEADGSLALRLGPAPVYLRAAETVTWTGSRRAAQAAAAGTGEATVHPRATQLIVPADREAARVVLDARNPTAQPQRVRTILLDAAGARVLDQTHILAPGATQPLDLAVPLADGAALQTAQLQIVRDTALGAVADEHALHIRHLPAAGAPATHRVELPMLDQDVYCLANEHLVVTIDTARGGRILELIDRASATNQLRLDYAALPDLPSLPFAYGIWTTLNGRGKNDAMQVEAAEAGSLVATATHDGLHRSQRWSLADSALTFTIEVRNAGTEAAALRYVVHPEYTVGGSGDSVSDVLAFPQAERVMELPFWSGLGERDVGRLDAGWWSAQDRESGLTLRQDLDLAAWAPPRVWFGQGHYNVELHSPADTTIAPGATRRTSLSWTLTREPGSRTAPPHGGAQP